MSKQTTSDASGLADLYPGLPSFVRQIRETASDGEVVDCFDHWSPREITGNEALDFKRGRQHCADALAFSRQLSSANFLLYVLMAMQGREPGAIERGFISGLIPLALAGRVPPPVTDAVMEEVVLTGADIGVLRENEVFMAMALQGSSAMPDLFFQYVMEMIASPRDNWIGAAIYLLVGAALNGSLN